MISQIRFRPPKQDLESIWIWDDRPSSKGLKLLLPVIKANKIKLLSSTGKYKNPLKLVFQVGTSEGVCETIWCHGLVRFLSLIFHVFVTKSRWLRGISGRLCQMACHERDMYTALCTGMSPWRICHVFVTYMSCLHHAYVTNFALIGKHTRYLSLSLCLALSLYIFIYIYTYVYMCMHIYIYKCD